MLVKWTFHDSATFNKCAENFQSFFFISFSTVVKRGVWDINRGVLIALAVLYDPAAFKAKFKFLTYSVKRFL